MRVYLPKDFAREARKLEVSDDNFLDAVGRAEKRLIDADLGGGLIKQRIARPGQGRSGGFRAVLYYRRGLLAIGIHIFPKSEKENLTKSERKAYAMLASSLDKIKTDEFASYATKLGWKELEL